MFGFGGRKKFESKVAILLKDLDHYGDISPFAESSNTSNQFRLSGLSEHETALGLCLTQVISLFSAGKHIQAINLLASAERKSETWISALVVRPELAASFFREVNNATGFGKI